MTMTIISFETKTGKYKGFYIVTHEVNNVVAKDLLRKSNWEIVDRKQNLAFYKEHFLFNKNWKTNYQIWTHPKFANHESNRIIWQDLLDKLYIIRDQYYSTLKRL